MLKNSFLIDLKENLKRRIWPFALFIIVTLFAFPIGLAISLQGQTTYGADPLSMMQVAAHYMGMNGPAMYIAAGCAIISAIQGFSYLYSRSKVDLYQSVPVSAKRRFWVIYLNGILIFIVPYVASLLIAMGIAASQHASSGAFLIYAWWGAFSALIEFLAVYHITILAVMLTGHLMVTCMATAVFLSYEWLLDNVIGSYCYRYFTTFTNDGNHFFRSYLTSPVARAFQLQSIDDNIWALQMKVSDIWNELLLKSIPILLVILAQAVLALLLSYLCYKKRPMEACGKAMAFSVIKAPVKIALLFLAGITGALILKQMSQGNDQFALLGLVSGLLLAQCIVEIIYEFDLRAVVRGWKSLLVATGLAALFYCTFTMDLIGYDRYVPQPEQLASAAVSINFNNSYIYSYPYETGYSKKDQSWFDYSYNVLDHMQLTDTTAVLELAKAGMGKMKEINADTDAQTTVPDYVTCNVRYNLKNGRVVYRTFPILYQEQEKALNQLFANQQYKESLLVLGTKTMQAFEQQCSPAYTDGITEKEVPDKDAVKLMACYRKDYDAMTFTQAAAEEPTGLINLYYMTGNYKQSFTLPVFSSYQNTIAYLKGKNAYSVLNIDPTGIAKIQIDNYQSSPATSTSAQQDTNPEKIYEDPASIAEIAKHLKSYNCLNYGYLNNNVCTDLSITITGADNTVGYSYNWNNQSVAFSQDDIPDFVLQDLSYAPQQGTEGAVSQPQTPQPR